MVGSERGCNPLIRIHERENRIVLSALSVARTDIEAVIEVFAKFALTYQGQEVGTGRGDNADALLPHTQQFGSGGTLKISANLLIASAANPLAASSLTARVAENASAQISRRLLS